MIKEATTGYEKEEPIILQGHMDMVAVKEAGSPIDMGRHLTRSPAHAARFHVFAPIRQEAYNPPARRLHSLQGERWKRSLYNYKRRGTLFRLKEPALAVTMGLR